MRVSERCDSMIFYDFLFDFVFTLSFEKDDIKAFIAINRYTDSEYLLIATIHGLYRDTD